MKKSPKKSYPKKKKMFFSHEDYNSNDGMLTSVWGPIFWFFLHTMSFNYPTKPTADTKKYYKDFILSLKNILPCRHCRDNLSENFKKLPITTKDMKNRETFSRYVYNLHELINKMLNKKSNLTYEEVRDRFEIFRSKCLIDKKSCKKKSKKKHSGCVNPYYGKKSKCVLKIIPYDKKEETIQIHKSCKLKKSKIVQEL
jgi:hypothetical protein